MRVAIVVLTIAFAAAVRHAPEVPQQPAPAACSAEAEAEWDAARRELGVAVPASARRAGSRPARRWVRMPNWYPVDGSRHVVCGVVHDTNVYYAIYPRSERDFHAYIVPSERHDYVLRDLPGRSKRNPECNGKPCIYGEVTAPDAFTHHMFGAVPDTTINTFDCPAGERCAALAGQPACMMGPWVLEQNHHWKAEIHPLDAFWSVPQGEPARLDMYLFLDGSKRFAKSNQFHNSSSGEPNGATPWAPRSRKARVGLAFTGGAAPVELQIASDVWKAGGITTEAATRVLADSALAKVTAARGVELDGAPSVCAGSDQALKGMVWLTVPVERDEDASRPGAATRLRITRSANAVPSDAAVRATTSLTAHGDAGPTSDTPHLEMDVIDVRSFRKNTVAAPQGIASYWHMPVNTPMRPVDPVRLTFEVRYDGTNDISETKAEELNRQLSACARECEGEIEITWRLSAERHDPSRKTIDVLKNSVGNQSFGAATAGGWLISTRGPWGGKSTPMLGSSSVDGPDRWRAMVSVSMPRNALYLHNPETGVLTLYADLENRKRGHKGTFGPFVVVTHGPDFSLPSSLGAGLDALSRHIVRQAMPNASAQSIEGVRQRLLADWKFDAPDPAREAPGIRLARVLHLTARAAMRDDEISEVELKEIMEVAERYFKARPPS